jgi:hypothetical protein
MSKKRGPKNLHPKKSMRIAGAEELDLPKSDALNIWDSEFGWILKDGRPTINTKAYWEAQRRKLKQ